MILFLQFVGFRVGIFVRVRNTIRVTVRVKGEGARVGVNCPSSLRQ